MRVVRPMGSGDCMSVYLEADEEKGTNGNGKERRENGEI